VLIPFSIAIAPAATSVFMGFLFFSFLVKKILKKERPFVNSVINLPFAILILISVISFKNSIDYHASFRGIGKLAQNAFLFLICAEEIKDKKHIGRIISSIVLGASLASFDALWQVTFGKDFIRQHVPIINLGIKRATAAFPNANVLGVYLSALAPLIIGLSLYLFKGKKKAVMFFLSTLTIIGIVLTFSRPTALALYISVLFLSIVRKNKALTVMLLVLLLFLPFIIPKNIKDWARQVNYNPIIFMCNTDRIVIYRNTINMIKHHPIIGVGINTFSKNYLTYKLPEPIDAKTGDTMYAHNNFLHLAAETGLISLVVFIWMLCNLFKYTGYAYKNLKDDYLKVLSISLTAGLIAFLINGLTETSLYYSRVAMIFWYLIGFSLSLKKFFDADRAR
jgi:O-antigen ligase